MSAPPSVDPAVDVVVVGSGHNGLVAACYLARAGLSVEVVEADDVLGGAVSTVQRWPGVRVDRGSSAHVLIRHSGIPEELDLAAHGLRYIDCDPWGFAPAPRPGAPGQIACRDQPVVAGSDHDHVDGRRGAHRGGRGARGSSAPRMAKGRASPGKW